VSFPTSCEAAVQAQFTRSVALLHSFWFNEGEKRFNEVLAKDPNCVIAYWGIAAILVDNTFVGGATPEAAKKAQEAIERGRALGAKTERERMYLEAVAQYWQDFANRLRSLIVAEQTNNRDKAKMFYTKVTQLVGTADSRPEFKGVRAYLVKN
jgi:hypothetical protein